MKQEKHTAGPWWVEDGVIRATAPEGGDVSIAFVRGWDSHQGEEAANANLIAAAPDLLDELENMVRGIEYWIDAYPETANDADHEALDKARKAIAKAKGKS